MDIYEILVKFESYFFCIQLKNKCATFYIGFYDLLCMLIFLHNLVMLQ